MYKYPKNVICDATHVFSSKDFLIDPKSKIFSKDISEFNFIPECQIYNDSADGGFGIRSEKTGDVVIFSGPIAHKDREGETLCWKYEPIPESVRLFPQIKDWIVILFND